MNVLRITGPSPLFLLRKGIQPPNRFELDRVGAVDAIGEGGEGAASTYTKNLTKLIPGEALSLFVAGSNLQVPPSFEGWKIWPAFCLVAAVIFRWAATKKKGSWQPQWWAIGISAISFILWVYTQGEWFLSWRISADYKYIVNYVMLFWVFVIPGLVTGDPETRRTIQQRATTENQTRRIGGG